MFRLGRHYGTQLCCIFCPATKALGCGNLADFTEDNTNYFIDNLPATLYEDTIPLEEVPPLARTHGFDHRMLLVDFMHSDLQGVGVWLLANALVEMVEEGKFGYSFGPWKLKMLRGLAVAFRKFLRYTHVNGIRHLMYL